MVTSSERNPFRAVPTVLICPTTLEISPSPLTLFDVNQFDPITRLQRIRRFDRIHHWNGSLYLGYAQDLGGREGLIRGNRLGTLRILG